MHLHWLSGFVLASSISARKAFKPRDYLGPTATGPSGTGSLPTGIYPIPSTGTGTPVYPTGSLKKSYPYTPTTDIPLTPDPPPPSSTSSLPPATPSTFKLQVEVDYEAGPDPGVNGSYVVIHTQNTYPVDDGLDGMLLTADLSAASIFTLNADHTLQYGDEFSSNDPEAPGEPGGAYKFLLFVTQATIDERQFITSVCDIGNGYLGCSTGINDVLFSCSTGSLDTFQLEAGPTGRPYEDFCYHLALKTIPV